METEERKSTIGDNDKNKFYSFLKEPLKLNLISPEDAQRLMELVEKGELSISDAYQVVQDILSEVRGLPAKKLTTKEKNKSSWQVTNVQQNGE